MHCPSLNYEVFYFVMLLRLIKSCGFCYFILILAHCIPHSFSYSRHLRDLRVLKHFYCSLIKFYIKNIIIKIQEMSEFSCIAFLLKSVQLKSFLSPKFSALNDSDYFSQWPNLLDLVSIMDHSSVAASQFSKSPNKFWTTNVYATLILIKLSTSLSVHQKMLPLNIDMLVMLLSW